MIELVSIEDVAYPKGKRRTTYPNRTNRYVGRCGIRKAVKAETMRLEEIIVSRYLSDCMNRMFGDRRVEKC